MTDDQTQQPKESIFEKKVSRRSILKTAGVGTIGAIIGASGLGGALKVTEALPSTKKVKNKVVPFYGKHQAGIQTSKQGMVYFASLDLKTEDRNEVIRLFQKWTEAADAMTSGVLIGDETSNGLIPPVDTGEAQGLSPNHLTITFGVGPTFFNKGGKARFGLSHMRPSHLKELPKFPLDALDEAWSGGDICIQACSDDQQVNFHAIRNLLRIARGKAVLRWAQEGFQGMQHTDIQGETPRNLFGFKDETVNPNHESNQEFAETVWVEQENEPAWLTGGTYMVVRRIQMHIEVWDRTTLTDQENTFGRHRKTGAPLGKTKEHDDLGLERKDENGEFVIPVRAHTRSAHGKGKEKLFRRSYSYSNGLNNGTGTLDAGLLFICYQKNPDQQFIPIQKRLATNDELNEYITHRGSAIFACFGGIEKGSYIGQKLFG